MLVVDCIDCLDSYLFKDKLDRYMKEVMTKYHPTEEYFEQNGGWVRYRLESFLKLHHKYPDLLLQHEIKTKERLTL